jgi:DNA-binding transcriptional MerR regulator
VDVLDIGEVVARSGLPASTLRYYEERGLIESVGRRGLRREFDARTVDQLALISLGRAAGFSLDEIGSMFGPDGALQIDRDALVAKADEIDRTIQRLAAMSDGLRHAAACRAPSHLECPTFRRLVGAAGSQAIGPRRSAPAHDRAAPHRLGVHR